MRCAIDGAGVLQLALADADDELNLVARDGALERGLAHDAFVGAGEDGAFLDEFESRRASARAGFYREGPFAGHVGSQKKPAQREE